MKYLFCNVGWMEHYDGIDGDSLERGEPTTEMKLAMKSAISQWWVSMCMVM